jgi:hypothetical protein
MEKMFGAKCAEVVEGFGTGAAKRPDRRLVCTDESQTTLRLKLPPRCEA